jgi:putative photosynthetic complex assembly protein
MHDHAHEPPLPRLVLRAAIGLILFSIVAVVIGQMTERGLVMTAPAAMVEERSLTFEKLPTGELAIRDGEDERMVALLPEGKDGFILGVLRGLNRTRAVTRTSGPEVYVLTRWDDGRLSLTDPLTDERIDVNGFGRDNLAAFAQLLPSWEEAQQ